MVSRSVLDRIVQFNRDYPSDRIALKYAAMAASPFGFLRGTCHLFYEFETPIESPLVWSCGDLHLQNFGTYKGDNRTVYFDINDFDEGALAPASWDLARWLTSLTLAASELELTPSDLSDLQTLFLDSYLTALLTQKAKTLSATTATGFLQDAIRGLADRDRPTFLDKRTVKDGKRRQLKAIEGKSILLPEAQQQPIRDLLKPWQNSHTEDPEFFTILDIAARIAGTGSLGLARYLILIEGKGGPDRNYLLDLKAARPSCVPAFSPSLPNFPTEADRILQIQHQNQESPPALLSAIASPNSSYILRELQPSNDKIELHTVKDKPKRLTNLITAMAQVTAWGQLRSSGRGSSATADQLKQWAETHEQWRDPLLAWVATAAHTTTTDYQTFTAARKRGDLQK
ncbi:MAG: DUF2252 family protein [Alkalinema sp. RU_4_3]|nr:DUF2252 family protein [Alkalinema sp. RU_4_3]